MNTVGVIATEWVYERYPRAEEVILTQVSRGKGEVGDPCRSVAQVHRKDGTFIAELDPCAPDVAPVKAQLIRAEELLHRVLRAASMPPEVREALESYFDPAPL